MRFDDFVLRAIEQLSQAIAAILGALRRGDDASAEEQLESAYDALLASDRVFLDMVDDATLANVLGSPAKVRALAQLSVLDARLSERRGDMTRAARLRTRARTLLDRAAREDPQPDDATLLDTLEK